ncbi:MAG: xanthine dehydrogenase family protein subunit M [Halioglobus sp.]
MYPAPFRYHRPDSLQAAVGLLTQYGDDARIMAGGQSVIPMMKLRMGEASELIDIGRLPDLSYVKLEGATLKIGALTTHALIAASEAARTVPLIAEAAGGIADRQVRSMGTIGGGLSVADPSGCWPTSLRTLDTLVHVVGPDGSRSIAMVDFILDTYVTALRAGELVTAIEVPVPGPGTGSAYVAFKRTAAAYPTVSCGMQLTMQGDTCSAARLALGAAGPTVVVSEEAEASLVGAAVTVEGLEKAADIIIAAAEPPPDARGSVAFKRAMLKTLVVEAGNRALARSRGEQVKGGHRYA